MTTYLSLSALFATALMAVLVLTTRASATMARTLEQRHREEMDRTRDSHAQSIALLQSTHLAEMEAIRESGSRMAAMAESAIREAEATTRAAQEQMSTTIERVTLTICRTVSPPLPLSSSDGNVTPEQRVADSQPWMAMLHPEEQREELELQAQRRRAAERAQREAAPAAGWVADPKAIQDLVVNGPPGDEAMAMAGAPPMWGFDPSL